MAKPLYQIILKKSWDDLPEIIRAMHTLDGQHRAMGIGRVERGHSFVSRMIASLLGMPPEAQQLPIEVTFQEEAGGETITRKYGDAVLKTHQRVGQGRHKGYLLEGFGPVTLVMALLGDKQGIAFHVHSSLFFGVPLPRFLSPTVEARERVTNGRYHYFVCIRMPFIGKLIEYEGFLILEKQNKGEGRIYDQANAHFDVV